MNEPVIYRREVSGGGEPIRITPRRAAISIRHAETRLGYRAPVSWDEAADLTWQWVQYARIV